MTRTPGNILPGGIVLIDEPEHVNVTTFTGNGEVLLTFNAQPGADFGQVIIRLSANQTLQLIERLQVHGSECLSAVAAGKGGARFPAKAPK